MKELMINSFVKDILEGREIDKTNLAQWVVDLIPEAIERAKTQRLADVTAKITKQAKKSGHTFDQWYEWAMSLYTITPEFKVISNARDWVDERSWETPDKASALERISILVGYKIHDRGRGRGDMTKDLESVV